LLRTPESSLIFLAQSHNRVKKAFVHIGISEYRVILEPCQTKKYGMQGDDHDDKYASSFLFLSLKNNFNNEGNVISFLMFLFMDYNIIKRK